jgi:drug/metabolite transporter (DMT)-like permease
MHMLWFPLALIGAVSQAAYSLSIKVLLRWFSPYRLAGFSYLACSLILLLITLFSGIPPLGPGLFPALAVSVAINVVATILFFRALATTDLSLCFPMLAFTPVFLILTSFVILGESPSAAGAAGILLVTVGAFLLARDPGDPALLTPFNTIRTERGVQLMLLVAFLYSISVNYDKEVVTNSSPLFGAALFSFFIAVAFLIIAFTIRKRIAAQSRRIEDSRDREPEVPATDSQNNAVPDTSPEMDPQNTPDNLKAEPDIHLWNLRCPETTPEIDPGNTIERHSSSIMPDLPATPFPYPVPLAFAAVGAVLALEGISINTAYTLSIVPYVITVKRLSIFFAVLFGWLLLHEKHIRARMTGAIVMIAGAVVIGLWG